MKRLSILGSTGSIGTSTLKVVRHLPEDFCVTALAAHSNIDLLEQQIQEFSPRIVAVYDEKKAQELRRRVPHLSIVSGVEGLEEVAAHSDVDFVVSAIVGTMGLRPTLAAIESGKDIGLANKEVLVAAGEMVMRRAREKGVRILPIDSEHSAIFQCLEGHDPSALKKIILTASGGPFRTYSHQQLSQVSPEQALRHPTWNMGPKVTVDCSTLMNKGLELIEARWLFGVEAEKIEVIIHPQSIIHSMVEFIDTSILAQMGTPTMVLPIQYAMTYPERKPSFLPSLDFRQHPQLDFLTPDTEKFVCLRLAQEAAGQEESLPCFMNAANEVLVQRFLEKQISWKEIGQKLEHLMERHQKTPLDQVDTVLGIDSEARVLAQSI